MTWYRSSLAETLRLSIERARCQAQELKNKRKERKGKKRRGRNKSKTIFTLIFVHLLYSYFSFSRSAQTHQGKYKRAQLTSPETPNFALVIVLFFFFFSFLERHGRRKPKLSFFGDGLDRAKARPWAGIQTELTMSRPGISHCVHSSPSHDQRQRCTARRRETPPIVSVLRFYFLFLFLIFFLNHLIITFILLPFQCLFFL